MGVALTATAVAALVFAAYFAGKTRLRRVLAGVAAAALAAVFVWSWAREGRAPAGFYGTGLLFAFASACTALFAGRPVARSASAGGALALVLWAAFARPPAEEPGCAGYLLLAHAASFMAGYALLLAAAVCAGASLARRYKKHERELTERARSASHLALAFLALGTVLGAFAARAAWGEYWTWNAKEAAILVPVALLAAARIAGARTSSGRKLVLVAAAAAALAYFAVGFFPASRTSPHPGWRPEPFARRGGA